MRFPAFGMGFLYPKGAQAGGGGGGLPNKAHRLEA